MTFAGYNAGRGRVRDWIKARGDPRDPAVDAVDWVERIPFSETRNYVQRVIENLWCYRVRFGTGTSAPALMAKPEQAPAPVSAACAAPHASAVRHRLGRAARGAVTNRFGYCRNRLILLGQAGTAMPTIRCGLRLTAVAALLLLSSAASAQLFQQAAAAPTRRAATCGAGARLRRPAPRPAPPAYRGALAARGRPATAARRSTSFLADLKQRAVSEGVSQRTLAAAAPYLVYDQGIVNRDRGQRVFGQIFTQFAGRMAAPYRMQQGQQRIQTYAAAFSRAEKEYGVPPAVIAAFWGLESDFGANMGNLPTLPSLVSLAYDCRRSEMFEKETIAALKIIERGDLSPTEMIGSWAGELGQTQFLPTHYFNYAVDYDGDGHRNLLRSAPDVIGSTANYIATGLKWRRGEPWLQEVRVPQNLPWEQTDLSIKHPRSKWAAWGVTYPDGKPLPNDDLPASVLLPMGRIGPAFLAYANFAAYTEWNNSLIYATTAGYLATRIAGAAPMRQPAAAGAATAVRRDQGIAAAPGARRLQCRQGRRRARPAEPHRGEGDAGEIRPAGGFLADRGIAGAHARPRRAGAARRRAVAAGEVTLVVTVREQSGPDGAVSKELQGPRPDASGDRSGSRTRRRGRRRGIFACSRAHSSCISLALPHLQQVHPALQNFHLTKRASPCPPTTPPCPPSCKFSARLSGLLGKAEAHCKAKNIQPDVLLSARLYPDMFPLTRQIQMACDFAAKSCARLTGSEVPSTPDTEKTFDELRQRIAKTMDYVKAFKPAQFDGAEARDITFPIGAEQPADAEGRAVHLRLCVPELLFPRRDRPRHLAPQRRRDRQAGFPRGEISSVIPGLAQKRDAHDEQSIVPLRRAWIASLRSQ